MKTKENKMKIEENKDLKQLISLIIRKSETGWKTTEFDKQIEELNNKLSLSINQKNLLNIFYGVGNEI
jgi:hypothetical protein